MAGVKPEDIGVPLVLGSNDFILFVSKKTAKPETTRALKEALDKLSASGEIKQIMSKYSKSFSVSATEINRPLAPMRALHTCCRLPRGKCHV